MREGQRPREGQLCLLGSLCPRGLHAQHLPWDSLARWRGPGSGHISWGTQVSSPGRAQLSTGQERQTAWHQPRGGLNLSVGRKAQATSVGKWIVRRGSLLTKGQEGPRQDKGGTAQQQEVPLEGFLSPGIPGSWHKTTPCTGAHTRHPDDGRKGEMSFLEQQGGEILEKAVFRRKKKSCRTSKHTVR